MKFGIYRLGCDFKDISIGGEVEFSSSRESSIQQPTLLQ
jgi:hypothetical protein